MSKAARAPGATGAGRDRAGKAADKRPANDTSLAKSDPWGAVPIRAASDPRLSGSHFRVLTVIARYAGFGKNGTGCYAAQQTLADATGLHITTISHRVADLVEWGYLSSRRQKNRRRKQYNVLYDDTPKTDTDDADSTDDTCSTHHVLSDEGCSDEQVSGPNTWPTGPYKDIPLRGTKRNSAEAALGCAPLPQGTEENSAKQHHNFVVMASDGFASVMGTACRLRRAASERPLTSEELQWLETEYMEDHEQGEDHVIEEAMSEHEYRWLDDSPDEATA